MSSILEQVLFPKFCVSCHFIGSYLCRRCQKKLLFYSQPISLPHIDLPKPHLTIATCEYKSPATTLIHTWKYQLIRNIVNELALIMVRHVPKPQTDYLCWLPASSQRTKERGFTPTQDLTLLLAAYWQIPVIQPLSKVKNNFHQAELTTIQARIANAHNSLTLHPDLNPGDLKNKSITIIDDVVTSGATLSAAVSALQSGQPKEINAVCFAHGI